MGIKLKLTGLRRFVRTEAEIADYTAQVAAAQDTLVNGHRRRKRFSWLAESAGGLRPGRVCAHQAGGKEDSADLRCADRHRHRRLVFRSTGSHRVRKRSVLQPGPPEGIPEVYFAGNNISSSYLNDIIKMIGDRDFCINIISKSGTNHRACHRLPRAEKAVRKQIRQGGGARAHFRHDR